MKSPLAPDIKSQVRVLRDAVGRIVAHFQAIGDELQILEEVHGFSGTGLPSLRESEQVCNHVNGRTPMTATQEKNRTHIGIADVAQLLDIDTRSFRRLRNDPTAGFPQPFQFGSSLRWKRAEVEAWIEKRRVRP